MGCSAYQQMSDYRDFQALCEREAGLHIYKKVKADEIFDESDSCGTTCASTLVDSQSLKRIGFCSRKYFGPFPDRKPPGCYVFEKGVKGDAACYTELEGLFSVHRNSAFFKSQCVRILPLEDKFRYRLRVWMKTDIINQDINSAISSRFFEVYDSDNGDVLLRKNHYSFIPRNYKYGMENHSKSCDNTYYEPGGVRSSSLIDMVFQ
jgi:hypothetical protein